MPRATCLVRVVVNLVVTGIAFGQSSFVNWESPQVHPLELTPDGMRLLAVNTADNRLEIFDVSSGSPVWLRSIPVGLDPVSVRARSNNEAWVINHISDSFSIVDLVSGRVVRTVTTGDEPTDVVFAGTPQRAFVSISQLNRVSVYDPNNPAAAPTNIGIQGEDPRALAVNAAGTTVYAAIFESGNKTTILGQAVVSQPGGPYGGVNPPPNSGNFFSPPRTPGQPPPPPVSHIVRQNGAGQWMDDNNRDWSASVTWGLHDQDVAIIDTATLGVTYATGLMTTVAHLAVAPSGEVTAVGTEALNEIRFEPNVQAIFIRPRLATFDPAAPAAVDIIDLNPHLTYAVPSVPQVDRDLSIGDPRAIAWHPAGDRAYIAGMGSNNVVVVDSAGARLTQIDVDEGPTGLAMTASGDRLYVLSKFAGSILVIDTNANSVESTTDFFDPTPAAIKLGRPFLYNTHQTSGLGQAACASCHIDGRTDHLGWDLGNPAGEVKEVNFTCRQGEGNCVDWHPMKGPMVTQTLLGIIGLEPFHWRGDRENLAAFAPAFTGLQGADAEPSAADLQLFTDFVATLQMPPNPNRNLDGTLRTTLPTSTGNGNAVNGQNLFNNAPIFGPGLTCVACHALPSGTDQTIDFPGVGPIFQSLKIPQMRDLYEKTGFNRASLVGNRGFGFNHDGDADTIFNLMMGPFNFPPGPPGAQQRRDIEAFQLSLSTDTHAAVGQQVTFDGLNNGNAQLLTRYNTFVALADAGTVGLVAKGRQAGLDRGYSYLGGDVFQSDRASELVNADELRTSAGAGNELTYTVVPDGSQERIGVDRDEDGYFDRDELDGCSDPADPLSVPPQCAVCTDDLDCDGVLDAADNCPSDANPGQEDGDGDGMGDACECTIFSYGDIDGSGLVDVDDVVCGLNGFLNFLNCPQADLAPCGGNAIIDVDDIVALLNAFVGVTACPDPCL